MTNEKISKIIEKGDLKTLLACSPVLLLLLNLGYYAYYRGYFYYFKIHTTYMESSNINVLTILFWIALILIYLLLNLFAFSAVVKKDGRAYLGLAIILLAFYILILEIDMKEIMEDFKTSDIMQLLIMYVHIFIIIYFLGIYIGCCVRWEKRKKRKKSKNIEEDTKNKSTNQLTNEVAVKTEHLMKKYSILIKVIVGLMIWLMLFFYFGITNAKQITEFKVVNNEYAVIYESTNNFLMAKIEDGKIDLSVQKTIEKKNIEVEIKVFEGNFIKRYLE